MPPKPFSPLAARLFLLLRASRCRALWSSSGSRKAWERVALGSEGFEEKREMKDKDVYLSHEFARWQTVLEEEKGRRT